MIDFELEIKNIQPINIKSLELKQYGIDDKITNSIIFYNKAVAEIKIGDLALAIKDLKKALSYNRGFAEAIKLLGLCYVNVQEYRSAEKTFKKLMKNEIYTEVGKEYIANLFTKRTSHKTSALIISDDAKYINGKKQTILSKHLKEKIIIGTSILAVFISSFSVAYWFSVKFQIGYKVVNSNDQTPEEQDNIQKKLDDAKFELDNYKNKYDILLTLNEAEKLYKDGDFEKASNAIINIKDMELDDETKTKFDKLWSDIKANGLWSIYNQGNRLYKDEKYEQALPKLKIVYEIGPSSEIMPWITYQIGMCYKETNDNANALLFFQKVKDNYPKSSYTLSSERMINQIRN